MSNNNHARQDSTVIKVKQFVAEAFLYDREDVVLTTDFQLIDQGVIDSMGIFRLITFLEEEFGVTVEPTEVEFENFATIDAIAALVSRKSLA